MYWDILLSSLEFHSHSTSVASSYLGPDYFPFFDIFLQCLYLHKGGKEMIVQTYNLIALILVKFKTSALC